MVCFFLIQLDRFVPMEGARSICPTAKDRKTDWKCCQSSEWVCKDHSLKTIKIKCDICEEQSY